MTEQTQPINYNGGDSPDTIRRLADTHEREALKRYESEIKHLESSLRSLEIAKENVHRAHRAWQAVALYRECALAALRRDDQDVADEQVSLAEEARRYVKWVNPFNPGTEIENRVSDGVQKVERQLANQRLRNRPDVDRRVASFATGQNAS